MKNGKSKVIMNCLVRILSMIPRYGEVEDSEVMDLDTKPMELNSANGMDGMVRSRGEVIDSGHTDYKMGNGPWSVHLGDVNGDGDLYD